MHHEVLKEGRTVAEGETLMVCVDGSGKLRRIPAEFKKRMFNV
jgi:acyl-CoA thioesterase FadM